jgi:uncharacterized protein (DUF58 family)
VALFLALYASTLHDAGEYTPAALIASLALLITAILAVLTVPALARRTVLERLMVKIDYELTREGIVYLLLVVAIVVAALNTGNNLLFIILSCLLAGLLASGVLSWLMLSELELEFDVPDHVFAQRPAVARLVLRNQKRLLPSFSILVSAPPNRAKRRRRGLRTHDEAGQQVLGRPVYFLYVPHGAEVTERAELYFPRRGRYRQSGLRVGTRFPFGLFRKSRSLPLERDLLVLPEIEPTEEFYEILPLVSGETEAVEKGRGHDLYSIRDYRHTDSARHVDWKATAKARQLKVREFTREDERRVTIVFDSRLSSFSETQLEKFERAVRLCACLAWHFYEIGAQIRFLSDDFEAGAGAASDLIYPVLEALAVVEPTAVSSGGGRPATAALDPGVLGRVPASGSFNVIVTDRPRGSIPTSVWGSSYVVFMDTLVR